MADAIVRVVDGRAVVRFSGPEAIAAMLAQAQVSAGAATAAAEQAGSAAEAVEAKADVDGANISEVAGAAFRAAIGSDKAENVNVPKINVDGYVRTVAAKVTDAISVLDFIPVALHLGIAAGFNTTDLQPFIQKAVNYVGARKGCLHFPAGQYRIESEVTVDYNSVTLTGEGSLASEILLKGAGIGGFIIGNGVTSRESIFIRDLGFNITATAGKTSGAAISLRKVQNVSINRVRIANQALAVEMIDSAVCWLTESWITAMASTVGVGVLINGGNDHYLIDILVNGIPGAQPLAGIQIIKSGATWLRNAGCLSTGTGLLINPGSGNTVEHIFMEQTAFDTCSQHGIDINPSGSGIVRRVESVGDWAATNQKSGIHIGTTGTVQAVEFYAFRSINNQEHGVLLEGGTDIAINGGLFAGNSGATSNTYDGIRTTNVVGLRIANVRAGTVAGFSVNQAYGINCATGTDQIILVGNDCRVNGSGAYTTPAGATKQLAANLP